MRRRERGYIQGYITGYAAVVWLDIYYFSHKYNLYSKDEEQTRRMHEELFPYTDLKGGSQTLYICFNDDETFALITLMMTIEE
jgi:hypothetical protein